MSSGSDGTSNTWLAAHVAAFPLRPLAQTALSSISMPLYASNASTYSRDAVQQNAATWERVHPLAEEPVMSHRTLVTRGIYLWEHCLAVTFRI